MARSGGDQRYSRLNRRVAAIEAAGSLILDSGQPEHAIDKFEGCGRSAAGGGARVAEMPSLSIGTFDGRNLVPSEPALAGFVRLRVDAQATFFVAGSPWRRRDSS